MQKTRLSQGRRRYRAEVEEEEKSSSCGCSFFILIILAGLACFAYVKREEWSFSSIREYVDTHLKSEVKVESAIPDPETYEKLKAQLASDRSYYRERFINARTAAEQDEVINQVCATLEHMMPKLMRCWLGHPWDFNGTATVPGEGKIACGYYVSVIMRDAGFKVERIKLAQQPSQNIIRTFLPNREDLWITGGMPYDEYVENLNARYDGINIVGLDKHVAFVVVQDGEMRFVHSGGLQKMVVDEAKEDAYSLDVSNYRVIGNLTRNRDLLEKWILDEAFPTAR